MDFKSMETGAILERRSAIGLEIEKDDADLVALDEELRAIDAELEIRKAAETKKAELRKVVAGGAGVVVEERGDEKMEKADKLTEIRSSQEYIDAFARYIKTEKDVEVRALLTTNAPDGVVPVPTIVEDEIRTAWEESDLIRRVERVEVKGNVGIGFELSATDAEDHEEGADAPDEEEIVFGVVTLIPKTIKKWITISDEVLDMTSEKFLRYIYREVTHKLAMGAEKRLLNKIRTAPTTATTTAVSVNKVTSAPGLNTIVEAIAATSSKARNLIAVMNKSTWAAFRGVASAANFAQDIFSGLEVVFTDDLPAYSAASAGGVYAIVGDFKYGALANYPNGEDVRIKFDEFSLAEKDLVKIIGRKFMAVELVQDKAFASIVKPESV